MSKCTKRSMTIRAALTLGAGALLAALTAGGTARAQTATPFEQSVYLYNQAYDTDLNGSAGSGTGNWGKYRAWLGIPSLGAEADPGWGPGDWWDCCQHVNWNAPWGTMQQRYGTNLPTVILGMGEMPSDPNSSDTWTQKLAWEDQQWQLEAANDPTLMGYFANYAQEVDSLGFTKVTIRLGYEFDGGWNPFGNLNSMSNMPGNYIKAWQNIVTTMRANDPKHLIKFCWNPTDSNVQIYTPDYYPGDAYVDYVGIDTYDVSYKGDYPVGTAQPTKAQQSAAWTNSELPRINAFADLARAHAKPMVIGEWGLWQLNDGNHPSGGDNPTYIQNMFTWLSDPNNHVAAACYFEVALRRRQQPLGHLPPDLVPQRRQPVPQGVRQRRQTRRPPHPDRPDRRGRQHPGHALLERQRRHPQRHVQPVSRPQTRRRGHGQDRPDRDFLCQRRPEERHHLLLHGQGRQQRRDERRLQ